MELWSFLIHQGKSSPQKVSQSCRANHSILLSCRWGRPRPEEAWNEEASDFFQLGFGSLTGQTTAHTSEFQIFSHCNQLFFKRLRGIAEKNHAGELTGSEGMITISSPRKWPKQALSDDKKQ